MSLFGSAPISSPGFVWRLLKALLKMSEKPEIKTVNTSRGPLKYCRDWDNDGVIVMLNARTINRYIEIRSTHPSPDDFGCFFAFDNEQYDRALAEAISAGRIREGEKLYHHPSISGLHGTAEGIAAFIKAYADRDAAIPVECDPQEVYFYEWNNYETMYSWDGDAEAIRVIIARFGVDVARTLLRFDPCDIDKLLARDRKEAERV